jgi:excisionase family DNA binding protein
MNTLNPAAAARRRAVAAARHPELTISVEEAGRRLGIGRGSAYQAAARGDLPVIRIGKLLRVPVRALEAKLDNA